MRKSTLGIVIAVLALLIIAAILMSNRTVQQPQQAQDRPGTQEVSNNDADTAETTAPATDQPAEGQSSSVDIKDMAFSPASVTVKAGTTVRWTNRDAEEHDVTPDQPNADFQGSELLSQNQTYEWTFDTLGTYTYHCGPHPQMRGTVIVNE